MSDLVGNPEDRFSHNEAHIADIDFKGVVISGELIQLSYNRGSNLIHFVFTNPKMSKKQTTNLPLQNFEKLSI